MTHMLQVWRAIAMSKTPLAKHQISARVSADIDVRKALKNLEQGGYIQRVNFAEKLCYTAIESPARLSISDIFAISKARL